jgi:hypothetical protein
MKNVKSETELCDLHSEMNRRTSVLDTILQHIVTENLELKNCCLQKHEIDMVFSLIKEIMRLSYKIERIEKNDINERQINQSDLFSYLSGEGTSVYPTNETLSEFLLKFKDSYLYWLMTNFDSRV